MILFCQVHAESGKGQFELALGHTICNHAADSLIYAREVIKAVSRKHGLIATFVPKYELQLALIIFYFCSHFISCDNNLKQIGIVRETYFSFAIYGIT